jgi:hypothetical protein
MEGSVQNLIWQGSLSSTAVNEFVGTGLMLAKDGPLLLLFPVLPLLFVFYNLRNMWRAYSKAKKKYSVTCARRRARHAEQDGCTAEKPSTK